MWGWGRGKKVCLRSTPVVQRANRQDSPRCCPRPNLEWFLSNSRGGRRRFFDAHLPTPFAIPLEAGCAEPFLCKDITWSKCTPVPVVCWKFGPLAKRIWDISWQRPLESEAHWQEPGAGQRSHPGPFGWIFRCKGQCNFCCSRSRGWAPRVS